MPNWLRRVRGAIGMGLTWGVGWAIGGLLIGVSSILLPWLPWDAFFRIYDAPLPTLALPGFIGGAIFSVVLGIAGRHRRFDELSLPRFTLWGAVGGFALSLVPAAMAALGLATGGPNDPTLVKFTAVICGPLTVMSAASAALSLIIARRSEGTGPRPRGNRNHLLRAPGEPIRSGNREREPVYRNSSEVDKRRDR